MPTGTQPRTAREIVAEMLRRQQADDDSFLDELVAADLVNHAAGPQGRSGLASILGTIDRDLGPVTLEQHHLIGDGDLVAQHQDLDVFRRRRARKQYQPAREPSEHEIQQSDRHGQTASHTNVGYLTEAQP